MHYYKVGVNGSGKTTLLTAIHAAINIPIVHGSTELMKYLRIPGDYDALRALDQSYVLEKWGETAEHIADEYRDRDLILDTHLLNFTNGRVIPRDGDWIKAYDALVLVKAKPETILERIEGDTKKDRAMFVAGTSSENKLQQLSDYQNQTEQLFKEVALRYTLPSLIINNDGSIDEAVLKFINFHDSMKGQAINV